jgi:uncharacterized protein (DUF2249 family)
MSIVDAAAQATPEGAVTSSPNDAVIAAIRTHHRRLADELGALTAAVHSAARTGHCGPQRDRLHDWYRTQLLPHAVAEERALYSPAGELDATRLLVCGMLAEHRALVALIAELALAREPFEVATAAARAEAVFSVHLSKENDLLLPALDQAGLELGVILDGMHEILGGHQDGHPDDADDAGGCGCGCSHEDAEVTSAVPVRLLSRPPAPAPAPPAAGPGELDVRSLPHGQRHEIIFARLDALAPGEALVIVNDHDPKPLRYQTSALWPDRFEWSYREAGPQVWRVAITRVG